jgi:hypothetical protein
VRFLIDFESFKQFIALKVADYPRYNVLVVQKSDTWLDKQLLGDEKKKRKLQRYYTV